MTLSRRQTLAIIGGGVIAAAGGATAMVASRTPDVALAPWAKAGQYDDPRMRALSWAILAPNPHNMQPWQVDLSTDGEVWLYVDRTRLLPHTDPFNRQITIGLGCFLEVLRIAALEDGLAAEMMLFPEGSSDTGLDDRPVARIRFVPTQRPGDPLFAQIQARHTLKEPYDLTQPVSDAAMQALKSAVRYGAQFDYSLDPDHIAWLREVTHDALRVEVETDATYRESVDVMRIGAREVNANPDGIDFSGPMFEMLGATGVMTRASLLDQSSTVFKQGMAAVLENADTAMGHFWMMTQTNTRGDQIMLGCDWVRVHLAATAAGVDLQPLSQALQEYPEVRPYYDAVHGRLAPQGQTVQMLARVGYGPKMPPSPRWPIDAKVVNA